MYITNQSSFELRFRFVVVCLGNAFAQQTYMLDTHLQGFSHMMQCENQDHIKEITDQIQNTLTTHISHKTETMNMFRTFHQALDNIHHGDDDLFNMVFEDYYETYGEIDFPDDVTEWPPLVWKHTLDILGFEFENDDEPDDGEQSIMSMLVLNRDELNAMSETELKDYLGKMMMDELGVEPSPDVPDFIQKFVDDLDLSELD